jgi:hypothetical protein
VHFAFSASRAFQGSSVTSGGLSVLPACGASGAGYTGDFMLLLSEQTLWELGLVLMSEVIDVRLFPVRGCGLMG